MKITKLTTAEQFINLKRGDLILVEWKPFFVRHHEGSKSLMAYNIYQNKIDQDEIICKLKGNHYFNWKMYLYPKEHGVSIAKDIYLCEKEQADEQIL